VHNHFSLDNQRVMAFLIGNSILNTGLHNEEKLNIPGENNYFELPFVSNPAQFCSSNFGVGYGTDHHQDIQFAKGTTTLAFKFQGGIIVSVDSRSTMGPYIHLNQ